MTHRVAAAFDLLEAVADAILVVENDHVLWANSAAAILTSYAQLDTMTLSDLIAPEWRDGLCAAPCRCEVELLAARGDLISVEINIKPSEFEGSPVDLVTIIDARPRKRLQQILDQRESTYCRVIEGSLDGFYLLHSVYDESGRVVDFVVVDVNAPGESLITFTREQLIGQRLFTFFGDWFSKEFLSKYVQVAETGIVLEEDFEFTPKDDKRRWYHQQVVPVAQGIAIFARNISSRMRMESDLRESEHRYQALLNQSNDCVSLLDFDGYYLLVNDQLASRLGYSTEEMVGMNLTDVIVAGEVSHYHDMDRMLKAGEKVPLFERTYRRKDGTFFQGEVNVSMVRDAAGNPLYVQSIMRDVTWRKEAEKALRESEERYRVISELISDYAYSFSIEPDGTPIPEWITDSFKRITGFSNDEIDAMGPRALYIPEDRERVDADMQRVIAGLPSSGEYRIMTKWGEIRWVHISRTPVWDEKEQRIIRMIGVAQDITERKQSEEELRRSEEKYRLVAENASDMITRSNIDLMRTYVSSACETILGYQPEEMLGKTGVEITHPDDLAATLAVFETNKDSHEPFTYTCRCRHKEGHYVWMEVIGTAIRDVTTDTITEYITVARDISQRKQLDAILMEQERLRYDLQKEQELSEVKSNLMRTISHEFRTPLALIVTATDFLDKYIDRLNAERRTERLQAIRFQVKHLSDMLDDITFVVQGTLHHVAAHPAPIQLEVYCRSIVGEIQASIGKDHQFSFTTDGQLVEGIADKALVLRILTNLLSNAVKYSPANSVITFMLYRSNGDAVLAVSDRGIGISPEEQKHIFEPFYRGSSVLDSVGGTGLGLSIVKDCVNLHGGTISVESEPGSGTTFVVRLPQTLEDS
jgi:PAS domain S-box-containing protein